MISRWIASAAVPLLLIAGCSVSRQSAPDPRETGCLIAGGNIAQGFRSNALLLFEAGSLRPIRTVPLRRSWVKNIARDDEGKIWVGYSGDFERSDNRVQVLSRRGDLLRTVTVPASPDAGICISGEHAFVVCSTNGTRGSVAVISIRSLTLEKTIDVSLPGGASLLLVSSASDGKSLVVAGLTSGPREASYAVATVIDTQRLEVAGQVRLGANTDVWRILPYRGRFYLLNSASSRAEGNANDVLVLDTAPALKVTPLRSSPSPLWGAIENDALYAFHNPAWNSTVSNPHRWLSRLDLKSGGVRTWKLPERWEASDLNVLDHQVVVTHWDHLGAGSDGLYSFDEAAGKFSLRLRLEDASRLLTPAG